MKSVKYFNSRTPKNDFLTTSTWTYEIKSKFRKYTCSLHWLMPFLYAFSVQWSILNPCNAFYLWHPLGPEEYYSHSWPGPEHNYLLLIIFIEKFSPLPGFEPGTSQYQADILPTELSLLGLMLLSSLIVKHFSISAISKKNYYLIFRWCKIKY